MRWPTLAAAGCAAVALAVTASCARSPEAAPRLIVLAWDGAGDAAVDRLLAEGRLPHLARLAASGVAAEHSVSSVPTKTAAAFATLWTGCWPDRHGVTENWVVPRPPAAHTLLESTRGYSSEALDAEPLFVTAAKAGRRVVVLSATQSYPEEPHAESLRRAGVPADRFLSFSGFEHPVADAAVLDAAGLGPADAGWDDVRRRGEARELRFTVADTAFRALVFDDPGDPAAGFDTVLIRRVGSDGEAALKAAPAADRPTGWSAPFPVRRGALEANTFFRLFELAPDGSRLALYQRRAGALRGAHSQAQRDAYLAAYPGFHDTGADPYRAGALGVPLMLGGDGTAEARLLEITAFDAELLARGTRFALETWRPDVLFHYSQATDDAGHLWAGLLDPAVPGHDPRLAERIWPHYARAFEQLDAWLGVVMELAPDAVVALVSDHGMAGAHRRVYLNRALEGAGLLKRNGAGGIALGRTRVLAADSPFFLRVNGAERKGGLVKAGEREAVLSAAAETLLAIRDPQTGEAVVTRVVHPRDAPHYGLDGAGDLYFDLAPGYYPMNGVSDALFGPGDVPWPEGEHGYWPERRDMHAIVYAAGPGLARGVTVPPIRHVDVAPTLARVAGLPAPPQAIGRVVDAMLAAP